MNYKKHINYILLGFASVKRRFLYPVLFYFGAVFLMILFVKLGSAGAVVGGIAVIFELVLAVWFLALVLVLSWRRGRKIQKRIQSES